MVEGNQNMVRVWGGGIYEHDAFYDICDGEISSSFWKEISALTNLNCLELGSNSVFPSFLWHSSSIDIYSSRLARFHVWVWPGTDVI
jgi:hypothetical protein